ncbi:PAS domain S-box protein [Azohydromonas sediminis]|uniref:PAS domain S-box protein n=1 Tax=Azohydromonas sediminis TaxID=2259674 RepID=UPI0013C3473C|nr:PAS domain S-box protein [Azohydromonas sediminis]
MTAAEPSRRLSLADFASSPLPVVEVDLDAGRLVGSNAAAASQYGVAADALQGRPLDELSPPDAPRAAAFAERALAAAGAFGWRQRRADGTAWDAEFCVIRLDAGPPRRALCALHAVDPEREASQRRRIERQLELTQFAIDHSPDAAFWIDGQGRVARCNEQACRSLGLRTEELVGREVWSFDPDFTPAQWAPLLQRLQREGAVVFETRHRRADGSVFSVEITASHIPVDGQSYGFCFARDISERKRAEGALREANEALEQRVRERTAELERQSRRTELILANTNDGFFAADPAGRLRDANAAFARLLGYTRDELLQLSIPDIEADESLDDVAAHIERVRREGFDRFDTRHRRKDGSVVPVEVSVSEVQLAGEPLLFAFVRDITQRLAQTRQLQAAKEEAERANLAKSEFLSRMSHELRTPLNAILGFGQLLGLSATAEQAAHVREIVAAGRHLLTLIDEVLDLARVESGQLSVSPDAVALLPLLHECLKLVRPQADARGVQLLEPPGQCHVHVRADRTRLKQVLLNLLSNAVKYNRPLGSVSVACVAEPGHVSIRVSDTGAGLTAEQCARLFVPFERLDAEARQIQGTGIGLALTKRLVELMDGTVGVESRPGVGSTFWVRLALAAPPVGDAPAESPPPVATAADGAAPREVLCIEDNPANLRLIEGIFATRSDIRLLTAIAPGLGLELARVHRPALILLDIGLPDMDGFAVLECLRRSEATRSIPVVAVSANAMPRDVERAKAAGFDAYLTKPLDIAQLLRVVDEMLGRAAR